MNKKRVIQLAAAGCMIIVLCAAIFLRPKTGELTLVNEAQESAVKATMEINGEKFEFDDIMPGAVRKLQYKELADNHYTVSVEFHYERKLGPQSGFFTDRVKGDHQLVIKQYEVVLESGGN